MEDDKPGLAELAESVAAVRDAVKKSDDTLRGVGDYVNHLIGTVGRGAHDNERIRLLAIDIDARLARHDERFDRIDEALELILAKVGVSA